LSLREVFQAFGLVAHDAFNLEDTLTRAGLAIDRLVDATIVLDLITEIGKLLLGVLGPG
jgi:hypothetical protein